MRTILLAIALVVCIVAGYLLADLRQPAGAGTTWQYETVEIHWDLEEFLRTIPAECSVDWEPIDGAHVVGIAYSCP